MTQKVLITRSGYDALQDQRIDAVAYDSGYDTIKYVTSGVSTITINDATPNTVVTVAHNLGYTPFFLVYITPNKGSHANKCTFSPINCYQSWYANTHAQAYADDTNLYLSANLLYDYNTNDWSHQFVFSYKIFANEVFS